MAASQVVLPVSRVQTGRTPRPRKPNCEGLPRTGTGPRAQKDITGLVKGD